MTVRFSDVTIREGGQMPGRSYDAATRVAAGRELDRLGLAYIQPGFAVAGEADRRAIETLAAECDADVVSIARAVAGDVEAALEAGADVIEVFGPLSSRQLEHTVGKTREAMLASMAEALDLAREGGATPHLTLVDAFRTDREHVVGAFERFDDVPVVSLADTVGAHTPADVAAVLDRLEGEGVDLGRAGVHFHDDLGVATANALTAGRAGVGKVDVSVAGLGERAGNPPLEEVVTAALVGERVDVDVRSGELVPVCRAVLGALGESVDPRKAVLGSEVTEHESPIHTAAMLSDPGVMEPYDPARFGGSRTLVFGAKTGRGAARRLLERAGREPTDERVDALLAALESEGPVELDGALDAAENV